MRRKTPAANPQTRSWTPENDCCNRTEPEQNHSRGCINNPANAKPAPEANPVKSAIKSPRRKIGADWVSFKAKGRCYVEGVMLDDAEQEITLSPRAAYRQRNNRNLALVEGTIPVLEHELASIKLASMDRDQREAYKQVERDFIDELEDGDPKVGPAPVPFTLIKQGQGK